MSHRRGSMSATMLSSITFSVIMFSLPGVPWRSLLVTVDRLVLGLQPLTEGLEGEVAGGRLVRVLSLVLKGQGDHVQQAVQIPAVEGDRPGSLVLLDLAVQAE